VELVLHRSWVMRSIRTRPCSASTTRPRPAGRCAWDDLCSVVWVSARDGVVGHLALLPSTDNGADAWSCPQVHVGRKTTVRLVQVRTTDHSRHSGRRLHLGLWLCSLHRTDAVNHAAGRIVPCKHSQAIAARKACAAEATSLRSPAAGATADSLPRRVRCTRAHRTPCTRRRAARAPSSWCCSR
jgi:hypothetical protein